MIMMGHGGCSRTVHSTQLQDGRRMQQLRDSMALCRLTARSCSKPHNVQAFPNIIGQMAVTISITFVLQLCSR